MGKLTLLKRFVWILRQIWLSLGSNNVLSVYCAVRFCVHYYSRQTHAIQTVFSAMLPAQTVLADVFGESPALLLLSYICPALLSQVHVKKTPQKKNDQKFQTGLGQTSPPAALFLLQLLLHIITGPGENPRCISV